MRTDQMSGCRRGLRVVVSSAFESAFGLAQLAQLAAAADGLERPASGGGLHARVQTLAHGLGTADWFESDVSDSLRKQLTAAQLDVETLATASKAFVSDAVAPATSVTCWKHPAAAVRRTVRIAQAVASGGPVAYDFAVTDLAGDVHAAVADAATSPPVVFLHGFLGASDDWLPVMAALSTTGRRCLAIDLPAHGDTRVDGLAQPGELACAEAFGAGAVVGALAELIARLYPEACDLVGYSMGGRLALLLAAQHPRLVRRCAVIGASPGLRDGPARARRAAADDALAGVLLQLGRAAFVEHWYGHPMWAMLRKHPRFVAVKARRQEGSSSPERELRAVAELAATLSGLSVCRQPCVWDELPHLPAPLLVLPSPPRMPCFLCFDTVAKIPPVLACAATFGAAL